ncbi:hypothetical protein A9K71_23140 [Mesorhizobium sp. WSM3873]|nr:hypothetical protein [Mesorhizobium japonicum]OBQ83724.1 hypothetical protein A9K71_23140 [Mesorhizobium sp. WSM3873]
MRDNKGLVLEEFLLLIRVTARLTGLLQGMLSKHYFPSFSTRPFEFKAYAHCTETIKDSIIRIVTLTRQTRADSFSDSIELVSDASQGRPVIVDFDKTPRPLTTEAEAADKRRQKAENAVRRRATDPKRNLLTMPSCDVRPNSSTRT